MVTKDITESVAEKVAAAITRSGSSKHAVADATGIPMTTFNRKINGHTPFNVEELALVARALNESPASFFPPEFFSDAA